MRITNSMMTNTMMLNINRNMTYLNTIYNQIASGKQIQVPSDDPILANRALRFRTAVAEAKQYERNTTQAASWMGLTENAFNNMYDLLQTIRERCEEGSSDTKALEDQQALISNIRQLLDQICAEANVTYAGRYVFSGYRTDEPMVLNADQPDVTYTISQNFDPTDIETITTYRKLDPTGFAEITEDVNIIKLAYTDMDSVTIPGFTVNTLSYNDPAVNPYEVDPDEINYIPETGELVLGSNIVSQAYENPSIFDHENLDAYNTAMATYTEQYESYKSNLSTYTAQKLEYDKAYEQYEEDLRLYQAKLAKDANFATTNDPPTPPVEPTVPEPPYAPLPPDLFGEEDPTMTYEDYITNTYMSDAANYDAYQSALTTDQASYATYVEDYSTYAKDYKAYAKANFTGTEPTAPNDPTVTSSKITYTDYCGQNPETARDISSSFSLGFNVIYDKKGFEQGELNPLTNFNCVNVNNDSEYLISKETQSIQYELGVGTLVTINTLGNAVLTDTMYADILHLCEFVDSIELSDENALTLKYQAEFPDLTEEEIQEKVENQIAIEREEISKVLNTKFGNMLDILDGHVGNLSTEHADLGSRMNRVDLISSRLADDIVNYTSLQSENEDVDMIKATLLLSSAEAIYTASLSCGSKVIQTTLADYI